MAKLIDVAEKAGVSVTTASMALSGKGRISPEVRNRVQEVADSLGYKRNRQNNNKHWVLILNMDEDNDHLSYFYNPIIRQLQNSARDRGYTLSILPLSGGEDEQIVFNDLLIMKVSSVFTFHYVSMKLFKKLESLNIPCVVINHPSTQDEFFTICSDDFQGAYEGTVKLISAGHRNISCIDYFRENLPGVVADRYYGFRKAVDEYHIPFSENSRLTVNIHNNKELDHRIREFFINSDPKPTAIFAHDDILAHKIIFILNKLQLSVPDDISIISPGDTLNYDVPETPRISTMRIDTDLMGKYATDMMIERLGGGSTPHILKIKQTFMDRRSIKDIN